MGELIYQYHILIYEISDKYFQLKRLIEIVQSFHLSTRNWHFILDGNAMIKIDGAAKVALSVYFFSNTYFRLLIKKRFD